MRLLVRTNTNVGQQREQVNGGFSIPNTTITWLSIIYLVISTLSNSLSSFISSTPQRNTDKNNYEMQRQNFEIQLLQRVLEDTSNEGRRTSLELLASASFFRDSKEMLQFIKNHASIPRWQPRMLEAFNTYSGKSATVYPLNQSPGNTLNSPPGNVLNNQPANQGTSLQRMADSSVIREGP